jgi:hypothetical protein
LNREKDGLNTYENLLEAKEEPYHWGTHYSTRVAVLYYLIRLEPFTRTFWDLQGSLDLPVRYKKIIKKDRTFHNVCTMYSLSSGKSSKSDVKELIPEFFFLPNFLINSNRINFGVLHNDEYIDDVELPKWAHKSAIIFVRKQREALESDYVSKHLSDWIDLIFGYKQK